jgi:hypothetical protein
MIPKSTAHVATSSTSSAAPPQATHRRRVHQTATRIPAMMHNAYARIGIGPRYQTPPGGLGRYASIVAPSRVDPSLYRSPT